MMLGLRSDAATFAFATSSISSVRLVWTKWAAGSMSLCYAWESHHTGMQQFMNMHQLNGSMPDPD